MAESQIGPSTGADPAPQSAQGCCTDGCCDPTCGEACCDTSSSAECC